MTETQQPIPFKELSTHLEGPAAEHILRRAVDNVAMGKELPEWPDFPPLLAQQVSHARTISLSHITLQSRSRSFTEKPLMLPHKFVQGCIDCGIITLREQKDDFRTSIFCDRYHLKRPSVSPDAIRTHPSTAEHTAA